jgi:hypothetical protein
MDNGRPSKYPADWTDSQKVAARTKELRDQGWRQARIWVAPGFDRARLDKYITRENKRVQNAAPE